METKPEREFDWFLRVAARLRAPITHRAAEAVAYATARGLNHPLVLMGRIDNYRVLSVTVGGHGAAPPMPIPPETIQVLVDAAQNAGIEASPAEPEQQIITSYPPNDDPGIDLVPVQLFADICGISPQRVYELESERSRAAAEGFGHAFPPPFVPGYWKVADVDSYAGARRTRRGPAPGANTCSVDTCDATAIEIIGSMSRGRRVEAGVCGHHKDVVEGGREGTDWVLHTVPKKRIIVGGDQVVASRRR